jgi:7-carboxy-7-deazaguanine synthase
VKTISQSTSGTKYKINEIFYSIQGEGFHAGIPAIFVRFSGCNLSCSFCDTNHKPFKWMTADQIVEEVATYPGHLVVLTGGEPTLQLDVELIARLKRPGKPNTFPIPRWLCLETNGTQEIPPGIDWVTVSPKENWIVKQGNELKVVYTGQNLEPYFGAGVNFIHHYLQPCSMQNVEEVIAICKRDQRWRVSIQLQKLLKIR